MNTRKLWFVVAIGVLLVAVSAVPARADTVVYDNGPVKGVSGININFPGIVSDSFLLTVPALLTGATIGVEVFSGDKPSTVDWSLGTSFFGSDIASGTSTLTNKFDFSQSGDDIYTSTLSFGLDYNVAPGTYYLTLQNGTTKGRLDLAWDINSGPSQAMSNLDGSIPSETFQILGDGPDTPEPASLLLLGTGLLGLAGGIRRRAKA